MKKMLNALFALALLLVQIVPMMTVNAVSGTYEDTKGTITIDNALDGKTYTIYQVLQLESFDEGNAYAYKVNPVWQDFVDSADIKDKFLSVNTEGYVSWVGEETDTRVAEFAQKALKWAQDNNISNNGQQTASGTTVVFENLNLGYYLVDSSVGVLCSLDTTDNTTTIKEKNTIPAVDKTVKENGEYGKENDATIGDTVEFQTIITVGKGAQNYVLHDTMSNGLTLNKTSFEVTAVKADGTVVDTTGKYTVKETPDTGDTFTIVFDDTLVTEVGLDGKITVKYTALLNENAVIGSEGNLNDTSLTYGDDNEVESTPTKTYVYRFDIVKTKSDDTVLDGAQFELYKKVMVDGVENKTVIKVKFVETKDGVNIYRVLEDQTNGTGVAIEAGIARIEGLDSGTYYLSETVIPEGYNKLAQDPEITITSNSDAVVEADKYVEGGLQVINLTGNELPETGGMGTVLFLTIGSIMVLGFGVLLVTKLRMSKVSL